MHCNDFTHSKFDVVSFPVMYIMCSKLCSKLNVESFLRCLKIILFYTEQEKKSNSQICFLKC